MPRRQVASDKRDLAKRLRRDQSSLEVLLWRELRDRRLGGFKFRRQVPIEGYVADFGCLDRRLIVEADGPLHRNPEQQSHDRERDLASRQAGFRILRFDGDLALSDLARVVAEIRRVGAAPSSDP